MGIKNLNVGTINDALGTFGLEVKQSDALFNVGSPEYTVQLKDGKAIVLKDAFERHGADAVASALRILNTTFLSLGELRRAVVDVLRDAAASSPDRDGIVTAILVLAA